jgi:hypothetical protein
MGGLFQQLYKILFALFYLIAQKYCFQNSLECNSKVTHSIEEDFTYKQFIYTQTFLFIVCKY